MNKCLIRPQGLAITFEVKYKRSISGDCTFFEIDGERWWWNDYEVLPICSRQPLLAEREFVMILVYEIHDEFLENKRRYYASQFEVSI